MRLIALFIFILLITVSCNHTTSKKYYTCEGTTQGTLFHVTYESKTDLCIEIDSVLQAFSYSLSNYDDKSVISKINNNTDMQADDLFIRMFNSAKNIYDNTQGAFDITIAPIANEWGFGWIKKDTLNIIDTASIIKKLELVGLNKVELVDGKIQKDNPDIQFISNGIAQGLSVDVLVDYLRNCGVSNLLVEIGGEVYASGLSPDGDFWEVGVDKPLKGSGYGNRENQIILSFSDWAVATSGNYRKYIEIGDKSLGHSLNPLTGFPEENNLLSVSVMAKSCMDADAYATACMVMGLDKGIEFINKHEYIEAYFIYLDEEGNTKTLQSKGFNTFVVSN